MGFIVDRKIKSSTWGHLDNFYVRIENYSFNKIEGKLSTTVICYVDQSKANSSYSQFVGENPPESYLLGGLIEFDDETLDLNDLNYFEFSFTEQVEVVEETFENVVEQEEIVTHDFNENGEVVEVIEKGDPIVKTVKVGEEISEKVIIDLTPISKSIYECAYDCVKSEFGKVFGNDYIRDLK